MISASSRNQKEKPGSAKIRFIQNYVFNYENDKMSRLFFVNLLIQSLFINTTPL